MIAELSPGVYVVWALSCAWYSEKEHSVSEAGSYSFVGEKVSPAIHNSFSSRSRLSSHLISLPFAVLLIPEVAS